MWSSTLIASNLLKWRSIKKQCRLLILKFQVWVVCPRCPEFVTSLFVFHYCKMILVLKLVNSFDKNLFLNKVHAIVVRISSMDGFRHNGVLPAIFCLLVREVGFASIIVAFSSTTVKFVLLELLLCGILFDLVLA